MKSFLTLFAVFGLLLCFPLTRSSAKQAPSDLASKRSKDGIYRQRIIGYWAEGELPYGIAAFLEGGVYKAWGYESSKKEKLLFTMIGKWWIENGRLYNTLTEMTPQMGSIEGVIIDKIVDITDKEMILIDDQGQRYTKERVTP